MQTSITEIIVSHPLPKRPTRKLPEVLAEPPCFVCPKSVAGPECDVCGCSLLTAWLCGGEM